MIKVKDFFVNEREFIIYHQHRQEVQIEDLLMEAPSEGVELQVNTPFDNAIHHL
jgi:hypothetical protein